MRSKFAVIGIVVALVVVAGAFYWNRGRPQASTIGAPMRDAPEEGNEGIAGAPPHAADVAAKPIDAARRARLSAEPLPSLDAPLRTIVRDLVARAEAGDARSMCRLAAEYQYCGDLQARMQMIESGVARAQTQSGQGSGRGMRSAERMAEAFDSVSERYAHCEGVVVPASSEIARHMRNAAAAGHPQASGYYVSGDMFRNRDMLENLNELTFYRDNAESLARTAIAAGDLPSAWALANAYAADPADFRRSLLAQAVEPAPAEALALLYGLRTVAAGNTDPAVTQVAARLQERIAALEQRLPQADVARARSAPSGIGAASGSRPDPATLAGSMFSRGRDEFRRDICD